MLELANTFTCWYILAPGCGGQPAWLNKNRVSSNIPFQSFAARLGEFMEASIADGDVIADRIECVCRPTEKQFDRLALQLFALQFKHNAAYRKICQARGCTPPTVTCWEEIPA